MCACGCAAVKAKAHFTRSARVLNFAQQRNWQTPAHQEHRKAAWKWISGNAAPLTTNNERRQWGLKPEALPARPVVGVSRKSLAKAWMKGCISKRYGFIQAAFVVAAVVVYSFSVFIFCAPSAVGYSARDFSIFLSWLLMVLVLTPAT